MLLSLILQFMMTIIMRMLMMTVA